jgi:tripeptide aminopeptidase
LNHSAQRLLDRFVRYVQIDTTACDTSTTYPSSPGQLVLGKLIAAELRAMGAIDVEQTDKGIVFATLPGVKAKLGPVVAWIAHLDTSPETTGNNVKPMVHENYQGKPIPLPGKPGLTLDPAKSAELAAMVGKTIITTDGSTLLGADDKAGVAVIIEAAHRLLEKPDLPRGTIRLCLTCDEEIGKGTDHLDIQHLGADWAYTLDGGGTSEIDTATFSADLAEVIVHGVNIHPAIAKDRMTNALRMAGMLLERLPRSMAPETTEGNKGFLHPYKIEGGVDRVRVAILLRDFKTAKLAEQAELLRSIARSIEADFPSGRIEINIKPQYRNMADGMEKAPQAIPLAQKAMQATGLSPRLTSVRGGTDGSRLTEKGLPCPNLSCGEHNLHSPLEWTCLEEMDTACKVLEQMAAILAQGNPAD